MKKKKPLWLNILLGLLIVGVAACLWEFISSQNPYILPVKRALKYNVLHLSTENRSRETAGLAEGWSEHTCVDGAAAQGVDLSRDSKRVYDDGQVTSLVNYLDGYQMYFPSGTQFDFSLSPLYVTGGNGDFDVSISRERASYLSLKDVVTFELSTFLPLFRDGTVEDYVRFYEYRFLLDERWQQNNDVTVSSWTGEDGTFFIRAVIHGMQDSSIYDSYLYATIYTGSREYLRVMYRYHSGDGELEGQLAAMAEDTRVFDPVGQGHYGVSYEPDLTGVNWSEETRRLYESYADFDAPMQWGIFLQDFYISGFDNELPALEKKLDYTFPVILYYRHLPTHVFPTEVMEENYAAGRLVELTLQLTDNNNEDMYARSILLDVYRGSRDEELRAWARAAADFGHPFLFRLNNEMNSDWTNYSGVVNLSDPQLYIDVWRHIYDIFREEGVDNCIWIYNPNDRPAPPSKWNNSLAFYPGNQYVQMIGVTGYNNGTYYTQWNEQWREFDLIYDRIWEEYSPHFSAFPWIITEFASSSVGGDKAAWIDNMFAHIGDYPNIRIAVWFSYADFDDAGQAARPYWLDETPETVEAFRRGLQQQFGG